MIFGALLSAGMTFRRLLTLRSCLLAATAGALAGGLVLGLPDPGLVVDAYVALVATFTAVLVLPICAGLSASDRRGGYEQLQGLRPIHALPWTVGRMLGSLVAVTMLFLLLSLVARQVVGMREVPEVVTGRVAEDDQWRFPLPKGSKGPFDLQVEADLVLASGGDLTVEVRRGNGHEVVHTRLRPATRHIVLVPDLEPHRGDIYMELSPGKDVVLSRAPPKLVVGMESLAESVLILPRSTLARLLLATVATLAFACAFRFETACLAGLLALTRTPADVQVWTALGVGLVIFASLGTSLMRRQALP